MSFESLMKMTALPCFAADSATQAYITSGFFLPGSFACSNAAPMRRQSMASRPVAHAMRSGRPLLLASGVPTPALAAPYSP